MMRWKMRIEESLYISIEWIDTSGARSIPRRLELVCTINDTPTEWPQHGICDIIH